MGRWINRDPIGRKGGVHLHAFAGNSPIQNTDRLGLDTLQEQCDKIAKDAVPCGCRAMSTRGTLKVVTTGDDSEKPYWCEVVYTPLPGGRCQARTKLCWRNAVEETRCHYYARFWCPDSGMNLVRDVWPDPLHSRSVGKDCETYYDDFNQPCDSVDFDPCEEEGL